MKVEPPCSKLVPQGEARPVGLLEDFVGVWMEEGVGQQHRYLLLPRAVEELHAPRHWRAGASDPAVNLGPRRSPMARHFGRRRSGARTFRLANADVKRGTPKATVR